MSRGMTRSSPAPPVTGGNPVLEWLDRALEAERQSMNLALITCHAELLKSLAPQLEGLEWRNGIPPGAVGNRVNGHDSYNVPNANLRFVATSFGEESPDEPAALTTTGMVCSYDFDGKPCWLASEAATVEDDDHEDGSRDEKNKERGVHQMDPEREITHRNRVKALLANSTFEAVVGFIIVVNSICMGIEASFEIAGKDTTVFDVLEHFFLVIYSAELALHFFASGLFALNNPWVLFDFIIVAMGVLSSYVVGPIVAHMQRAAGDNSVSDGMAGLLVLRMLRLFRLARIVRLLVVFKTLWMLIRGLLGSAGTIGYTFCLIFLILYIFSCMTVELVTKRLLDSQNEEVQTLVNHHFPNLLVTMLSLVQFVTMDSMSSLYFPLVSEDPVLIVLFLPFILILSISVMNLVTAVIVEGAIEQGKHDRETAARYRQYAFKKMVPHLRDMFHQMDIDGDAALTLHEIETAPEKIKEELNVYLQSSDALTELFEMIDVDESGEVDIDEFCDGIAKLVNSDAPIELVRIMKQLKVIRKEMKELKSSGSLTHKFSMEAILPPTTSVRAGNERMMLRRPDKSQRYHL